MSIYAQCMLILSSTESNLLFIYNGEHNLKRKSSSHNLHRAQIQLHTGPISDEESVNVDQVYTDWMTV